MKSVEVRKKFLEFFQGKSHLIVPSAPMVIKDDPTLMFTNAGMNQFKDIFLGHKPATSKRIADTQKCLRVSGKHNDLEEVGHDTYHHTMFEMLGNWSFGDYFKQDAINWAWELLTEVYKIDKNRLYVTVFGGDANENLGSDEEAKSLWKSHIDESRIIYGSKKDNFWEMGDVGPCGPCSEVHVDIRPDDERAKIPGKELVNHDHPQVIEIWNLVFIEFNRKADGSLEKLPDQHVDTGMGFERLSMVLQGVRSNYDTDIFQPMISRIGELSNKKYGDDTKNDIAMRVISDHIRAVAFAIADGQMPSNNKAGYVIRRILRRAVRYGYTFLGFREPFMFKLVEVLESQMSEFFPELKRNKELIMKVIEEEENSFLKTLSTGLSLLQKLIDDAKSSKMSSIKGVDAFELYDTYGFPFDLTELILRENGMSVSKVDFDVEMEKQKSRSRADAAVETGDMITVCEGEKEEFVGYDSLTATVKITKYRKIKVKNQEQVQLVFDKTPFYAESGGQVGDTGFVKTADGEIINVLNTTKENNLIIHVCDKLPANIDGAFEAVVDVDRRKRTALNHTATHLMHHALRQVLGNHVEQKGSLVTPDNLRFDFSHFKKMEDEEIMQVEKIVNKLIRLNSKQDLFKDIPMAQAVEMGAMALFGEKYGDTVRAVRFGESIELCGGTHVGATGEIGLFVIKHETSIAAGIRRIEALTGEAAEDYFRSQNLMIAQLREELKNPKDLVKNVVSLISQNKDLQKQIDALGDSIVSGLEDSMVGKVEVVNGLNIIRQKLNLSFENTKKLTFALSRKVSDSVIVLVAVENDKPMIFVSVSENLVKSRNIHAGNMVRELAKEVNGGGGGQPHFASAGGKDVSGIGRLLDKVSTFIN